MITTMFGKPDVGFWRILYFCNHAFLVIALLFMFMGTYRSIFTIIVLFLLGLKIGYNILYAINEKIANVINSNYYTGIIVLGVVLILLIYENRKNNDRERKR